MDNVLTLIDGETERIIFCKVFSITQTEFFSAAQSGLKPQYKITVLHAEYNDERMAALNGKRYAIYRSYNLQNSDRTELYLVEKVGIR